jgi:hypothetical protein
VSFRGEIACFQDLMGISRKYNLYLIMNMNLIDLINTKSFSRGSSFFNHTPFQ